MAKKPRSGKLRHLLQFGKMTHVGDSNTGSDVIQAINLVVECDGNARNMNGREVFCNRTISENPSMVFEVRYNDIIDDTGKIDHVVHDNRVFEIKKTEPMDEVDRFLKFLTNEIGRTDGANPFTVIPIP